MISDTDWQAFDVDLTDNHMLANNRAWTNNGVMFGCQTTLMGTFTKYTPVIESGPLTLATAKKLYTGQWLYHTSKRNADGSAMRAKVTSVKTWKRSPERIEVRVKHGMYDFTTFDEREIHLLTTDEPIYPKQSRKSRK